MAPGPALFFTAAQLQLTAEPPLADLVDHIEVEGLAPIEADLAAQETALRAAVSDLTESTFGLQDPLDIAASEMSDQLASRDTALPPGLVTEISTVNDFMDGAESSLPAEAYTELAEPYVPPPNVPELEEPGPKELE